MTEIYKNLLKHKIREQLMTRIQSAKLIFGTSPSLNSTTIIGSPYFLTKSEIEIFERTGDKIVSCVIIENGNYYNYTIKFARPVKKEVIFEKYKTFNKILSEFVKKINKLDDRN